MGHIRVNHSKFEAAAAAIETYVANHGKNMNAASQEVTALSSSWQGKDSAQFQQQWDRVADNDSTAKKMAKSMESYAKFLRYAAGEYKNAQAKAVNRANDL
ncbi:WXG100 family type VII secretion target [Ectobacillus ponti]|uniref:WXG100 family type VII secretion target n=1 Tax=Ectobacillus ponti TaxID=2961894 RepID=A0AA41X9V5_9BACI|nr:WXG100 family type VII secretion target [Ectobacillus ponti]